MTTTRMSKQYNHEAVMLAFEHIKETLERIETQTVKTNGRVTKSEDRINDIEKEQATLMAKVGMASTVVASIAAAIIHKFI